jgi:hypothetical protein
MKKNIPVIRSMMIFIFIFSCFGKIMAQDKNDATAYLMVIEKENNAITKDLWDYTASVAHGKNAKKIESRRKDLINTLTKAIDKIGSMEAFQGDNILRDSLVSFLNLCYNVLIQDYAKIVDLEEIAEQSYDEMEAYMMAQEKANNKLDAANDMVTEIYKRFADDHKIHLLEKKDKITVNLLNAGNVFKYYNNIYLIFFKNFKQEGYVLDALEKNDLNSVEQNRSKLIQTSSEDLKKLDTTKSYKGDPSLKSACTQLLKFYNNEASKKILVLTDFELKKENFEKIKTAVENKDETSRTKSDIDEYNKAATSLKKAIDDNNRTNKELNNLRSKYLSDWNYSVNAFMDKYIAKK